MVADLQQGWLLVSDKVQQGAVVWLNSKQDGRFSAKSGALAAKRLLLISCKQGCWFLTKSYVWDFPETRGQEERPVYVGAMLLLP